MQLDLFLDSRAVMLANDVIGALAARDPERTRAVLGHLHSEAPEYPGIDPFERLTVALATWSAPGANATAINSEVDRLDRDIVPAAHQILGEVAAARRRASPPARTESRDLRAIYGESNDPAPVIFAIGSRFPAIEANAGRSLSNRAPLAYYANIR